MVGARSWHHHLHDTLPSPGIADTSLVESQRQRVHKREVQFPASTEPRAPQSL